MQAQIHKDIEEYLKKTNGMKTFVMDWKKSTPAPHTTISVHFLQCLNGIGDMLGYMLKSHLSSDEVWYTLYDLNLVLTKANKLVRKCREAAGRVLGRTAKCIKKITLVCNRLYGIHQLLTYFASGKYEFRASYVIADKDAATFWVQTFGDNWWYKDYSEFCEKIKRIGSDAYSKLKVADNPDFKTVDGKVRPRVVTAIRFAMLTDHGLNSFRKSVALENPFLIPKMSAGMNVGPAMSDSQGAAKKAGIESGKTSEYFYIVSECKHGESYVCLQVSDKEPGSNIIIGELNYNDSQQWRWEDNGSLVNRMSILAIDVDGREPASGKKIVQWPADGSPTQQWLLGKDGYIRSGPALNEPICLDLDKGSTALDTPCLLWNIIPGRTNQLWNILPAIESSFDD